MLVGDGGGFSMTPKTESVPRDLQSRRQIDFSSARVSFGDFEVLSLRRDGECLRNDSVIQKRDDVLS